MIVIFYIKDSAGKSSKSLEVSSKDLTPVLYEDQIEGSDYIYYRNDSDENGEYVEDAYNFLYKVVDQIPPSDLIMSEIATEMKQSKKVVGCIIKLKDHES